MELRLSPPKIQVHIHEDEGGPADLEGCQVGVAVKALEGLRVVGQLDRAQARGRKGDLADLFEQRELGAVIQECRALVVARGVRHQHAVGDRQLLVQVEQVAEVLAAFLDGDEVEPTHDLGDQGLVLVAALLRAEVGDVPGGDQQPVGRAGGDVTRLLVRARSRRSRSRPGR